MQIIVGKVSVNEDWEGESYRDYMQVISKDNPKLNLDDLLVDYNGDIVKITIERIN